MSPAISARRPPGRARPREKVTAIHPSVIRVGAVSVGAGTEIGPFTVLGGRYRRVNGKVLRARSTTRIGRGCQIGSHVQILRGSEIGDRSSIDGGCTVEQDVVIGETCVLTYHATVCNEATLGRDSIIGGFIGERSKVGEGSRVFGQLIHRQDDPARAWDDTEEESPVLGDHVFVGFGAVIIGGVRIGRRSFVCAGALVTEDVPDRHIVRGDGEMAHHSKLKWRLAKSRWFSDD